jgi:hypothetical protein
VRLDTDTGALDLIGHPGPTTGVVIDRDGRPWFGGDLLHSVEPDGPFINRAVYEHDIAVAATDVTVSWTGTIWAASGPGLAAFDPVSKVLAFWALPASAAVQAPGIGEDDSRKIWVPLTDGTAVRFDEVVETFESFDVDPGRRLEARGAFTLPFGPFFFPRLGTWTQILDGNYANATWTKLEWTATEPRNTVVQVHARFAATREGLDTTSHICGPYLTSPVDLTACPSASDQRFMAFEVALRSAPNGKSPTVGNFRISLTRP